MTCLYIGISGAHCKRFLFFVGKPPESQRRASLNTRRQFYRAIWYSQWRLNEALWIGLVALFCWAVGNPTEMRSRSLYTSIVDPESSGIRGGRKGKTYIRSRICPLSFFSFPTTPRSWRAMWAPRMHADVLNIKSAKHFLIDKFIQGLDATRGGHGVARRYSFYYFKTANNRIASYQ